MSCVHVLENKHTGKRRGMLVAANVSHVFMPAEEKECFLSEKGMNFASEVPLKNYLLLLLLLTAFLSCVLLCFFFLQM